MSNPQFNKQSCRPRDHLIAAGKLYPQAWKQADELRADRGVDLPDWPDWCFMPLAGWYSIVSADASVSRLGMDRIADVARLAAIGAWRVTQGIYRFDPALYDAIIETPVTGDLPCDVLYRMPEWCVYIETPGLKWVGAPLYGALAHLEHDANNGHAELRLLLDSEINLAPVVLHLGVWSLDAAIDRMLSESVRQARGAGMASTADALADNDVAAAMRPTIEPIISLLLYLCSANSEIGGDRRPENPRPKKTKSGWRLFPADKPTTWDVGVRLGAALRRAYHDAETGQGGTHAGPRPHIRRAHWHGFRSGAMKRPDGSDIPAAERKFELRWLPPIPVNLNDVGDLPTTIRPVKR